MAPNTKSEYLEIAYQRSVEKKTHVSFPQLKYPSLRDEGVKDPIQWLKGKAMDDGAEGFWRVHNGLYDLTDFMKKHPGGEEWLDLSKGTDITEAFETHHFSPSVYKILEKYYVRDAKTPRNSPFTFKEDGFYKTLKREVVEVLKTVPKHTSRYSDMIIDGIFITLLVSSVLSVWLKDDWWKMISYIVASLSLAWLTIASHNYIHRRTNWRMYLFNVSLWSYRDFRVSHALSHHLYPNTLMDLEVSAFEPLVFWNPRKDVPFLSKFAILIELATFPFAFMRNWLTRFISNFFRKDFFRQHYRWHDGIGLLLPVWMWLISGAPFSEVFVTWLWINCTASGIFYNIGSNAAHHHPKIFKDGDEVRDENPDWGVHELEAVMDRVEINSNHFTVMTFFGNHALHHIFPTLDHAVLPYLWPVFLKNCEKFKARFKESNQLDLIIGQIKSTLQTEPALLEDDE